MGNVKKTQRSEKGMTITEMVISALLMGFCFSVIGELVVLNTLANTLLSNKISALTASRQAMDRLSSDIRIARSIGDCSSGLSTAFPDDSNLLYSLSDGPSAGWPGGSWNPPKYILSPQTLVLQQPVLYRDPVNDPSSGFYNSAAPQNPLNGFPIKTQENRHGTSLSNPIEYLDTVVYNLVEDPAKPGEYLLQVARFAGEPPTDIPPTTLRSAINPPQTILKGIVGPKNPIDPAGKPAVFRYYKKSSAGRELTDISQESNPELLTLIGVSFDVELKRPDQSAVSTDKDVTLGFHTESFLRQNSHIVLRNLP